MTAGEKAGPVGIDHATELVRFAEAVVVGDDEELDAAREALLDAVGPEAFVDAAAVVGNFQRMVRIADGTGIPLDASLELLTGDLRGDLGIGRFGSAANTPEVGWIRRTAGRALRPIAFAVLRRLGRRS